MTNGVAVPGLYLPSEDEFDPSTDDFVLPVLAKERNYKHFDLPLAEDARLICLSDEKVNRRFWPLLGFTDISRRYARTNTGQKGIKVKGRPIRFASHEDAAYLQAYAAHLGNIYEAAITSDETSPSVLAYRGGSGTNIHHAKALFDEIRTRENCAVFAMDISGFFDCLDHILLRDEIGSLLGRTRIDGHHGSAWRNVTRYSWVETDDLDELLGKRRNEKGRICSPSDYITKVQGRKSGLIRTHQQTFGIPQGTPVSGLYANIYMRTFDREMIRWCNQNGGSYRRYSDDIAVVLPLGPKQHHVAAVVEKILADYGLAMSVEKTESAEYIGGLLASDSPIQYLGFTFDGERTLIRATSIDAYRAKMRRGIHAKLVAAKMKGVPPNEVFRREALARYTHLGKRRNFLRYAYKAAQVMDSVEIRDQVKRHMRWFHRAWETERARVYGV